jgi:hypothetical protein
MRQLVLVQVPAGYKLYKGQRTKLRGPPRGPAFLTNGREVATAQFIGPGYVHEYRTKRPVALIDLGDRSWYARFFEGLAPLDPDGHIAYVADVVGAHLLMADHSGARENQGRLMAAVCAAGYDGWIVRDRSVVGGDFIADVTGGRHVVADYFRSHEIMLCAPKKVLALHSVKAQRNVARGVETAAPRTTPNPSPAGDCEIVLLRELDVAEVERAWRAVETDERSRAGTSLAEEISLSAQRYKHTKKVGRAWVEVDMPLVLINYQGMYGAPTTRWGETARAYAALETQLPPAVALYPGIFSSPHLDRVTVWDGSHRTFAAKVRGACAMRLFLPKADFTKYLRHLGLAKRRYFP